MDEIKLPHHHGEGEDTALLQEELDRVDYFQTVAEVFRQLDDTAPESSGCCATGKSAFSIFPP